MAWQTSKKLHRKTSPYKKEIKKIASLIVNLSKHYSSESEISNLEKDYYYRLV